MHDVFDIMKKFLIILLTGVVMMACGHRKDVITLSSFLDDMTDMFAPVEYPVTLYTAGMVSSHDRSSVSPDDSTWFANEDGFGYERLEMNEGREEKVLFEEKHPGVITRIWITTRNPKATLRFYFDGHTTPDWVMKSFDFTEFGLNALKDNSLVQIHTSYEKGIKGGQTFYLPIPYSKGCKITLEEPEGWTGVPRYYHIEYRRYPDNTEVETFSVEAARKYSDKIVEAGKKLSVPVKPKGRISKGDSVLVLPKGNRAVTYLSIKVDGLDSTVYENTMRRLIFKAEFDGKQTIRVPLSDFSGAGMGARPVSCRQMYADGSGHVISYWIMPYKEYASFEIENMSGTSCEISLEARTCRYRFGENTLYFHSSWHASDGLQVTNVKNECLEWDFSEISGGRGIYAGDNLTLFNHSKAWYGEGDEKIYVDGSEMPVFFGTGTEDYYNSSWAPVVVFHTPFGGAPRADLSSSRGYNTFLRTRILDLIPFSSNMDFDLELISWIPGTVDYASTVYWYGDPETDNTVASDPALYEYDLPAPPPDPEKFVISNSIEAESLIPSYMSDGLNVDRQNMAGFPDGMWSGAKQLVFYGGRLGDKVSLVLDGLMPGKYEVGYYLTMASDYGIVAVSLDENEAIRTDCYFPSVINSGYIPLGRTVSDGKVILNITLVGSNPKSTGTMFGIDCIVLKKMES